MSAEMEHRIALQAGRGIAALEAMAKIHDLALTAQTARDEAKIKFDRALELANDTFARAVIAVNNDFTRMTEALADHSEDEWPEDDD